ncbi:DUF5134 domain-containing protein [Arthrobacter sp. YAF17]|uniref:DUF5134 domain-containing protein n=1 Tax=Arthrobacter sp. YAF17 TaxID=3233077 RepID=UPI003F8E7C9C
MIENGVLSWGLTALLLAASLYAAFRACRKSTPATRAGFGLHAAMMTAMALMLAPGLRWPALPQILFFGLAAWWFVLRAVSARPFPAAGPGHRSPAGAAGPGSLLYNGLTMAAMAYMLAAMDVHGGQGALAGPNVAGFPGQTSHHASAAAVPLATALPGWNGLPVLVLAVAFGVSAVLWAFLLLRRLHPHTRRDNGNAFLELVSAAAMSVMFSALAAA